MSTAIKKKMNLMFKLFLFFYLIIGFYLSINTGISTDEFIDQYNWKLNLDAIKDFFGFDFNLLMQYSRFPLLLL